MGLFEEFVLLAQFHEAREVSGHALCRPGRLPYERARQLVRLQNPALAEQQVCACGHDTRVAREAQ